MASKNSKSKTKVSRREAAKANLDHQFGLLEDAGNELEETQKKIDRLNKLKTSIGNKHKKLGGLNYSAPFDLIDLSKNHRKIDLDSEEFLSLKESIRSEGLLQRPVVTLSDDPNKPFLCVAGHRRILALKENGNDSIPVIISDFDDNATVEAARLAENVVRKNLEPIELAEAVLALKKKLGESNSGISRVLNKSRGYIISLMKIAEWPKEIKDLIKEHNIKIGPLLEAAKLTLSDEDLKEWMKKLIDSSRVSSNSTLSDKQPPKPANTRHGALTFGPKNKRKYDQFCSKYSLDEEDRKLINLFLQEMKIKGWNPSVEG